MRRFQFFIVTLGLALLLSLGSSRAEFSPEDFEQWADETFGAAYEKGGAFSGMALIAVEGGEVVARRSYGFADYDPKTPISFEDTRFLIGSISKTFTGVAIAQLVERGIISSIDDPAQMYLKRLELSGPYKDQIRIRDLLTHSAGYDQRNRDVGTLVEVELPISEKEAHRIRPDQIRPPGEIVSYSNYSTGLLALIVEDQTGMSIEEYFDDNIWSPLGMDTAQFERGASLAPGAAIAHAEDEDGAYQQIAFLALHPFYWPVGAISLSPNDIAKYAVALLEGAGGQDTPLLSAEGHKALTTPIDPDASKMRGFAYKFRIFEWSGNRIFGHGGNWPGYESMLHIYPDENVAVFFSIVGPKDVNSLTANIALLNKMFGPYSAEDERISLSTTELSEYAGLYRSLGRSHYRAEAVIDLLGGRAINVAVKDGGLTFDGAGPYFPIGDDIFWSPAPQFTAGTPFGSPIAIFVRNKAGDISYVHNYIGLGAREPIPAYEDPGLRAAALGILQYTMLLGLAALFWPRNGVLDAVAKFSSIASSVAMFRLLPTFLENHGPGGLTYYVISGADGRFNLATFIGMVVTVSAAVLLLACVKWNFVDAKPIWVRIHVAIMALMAVTASAILVSVNLVIYSVG